MVFEAACHLVLVYKARCPCSELHEQTEENGIVHVQRSTSCEKIRVQLSSAGTRSVGYRLCHVNHRQKEKAHEEMRFVPAEISRPFEFFWRDFPVARCCCRAGRKKSSPIPQLIIKCLRSLARMAKSARENKRANAAGSCK